MANSVTSYVFFMILHSYYRQIVHLRHTKGNK